jgi:predicted acetyltransferase
VGPMPPSVRTILDDELANFIGVVHTAMLLPAPSPETVEERRRYFDLDRCLGAYDDAGGMCGGARAFATELSVPGGAVPAAAVSAVGVLPTYRRQGHLGRLMRVQLDDVRDRGEPVAILVAAEYPIYGRYGYGPATYACGARIDAAATWRHGPTGTIELARNEDFAEAAVAVYDRVRQSTPGHISWDKDYWDWHAGLYDLHDGEDTARRDAPKVIWYDPDGEAQGVVTYRVKGDWVRNRPQGELSASILVAATPTAERELFRFLTTVDWISTVRAGLRPADDPLPLWLVDGRAAVLDDNYDHVWLRPLDVPAALTARGYAAEGTVVLEVVDPAGYAGGRFELDAQSGGATCTPTTRSPDITAPADALGAAYLGGTPWTRLAAAGWIDEHTPGAAERARALFSTPRAPWCATTF